MQHMQEWIVQCNYVPAYVLLLHPLFTLNSCSGSFIQLQVLSPIGFTNRSITELWLNNMDCHIYIAYPTFMPAPCFSHMTGMYCNTVKPVQHYVRGPTCIGQSHIIGCLIVPQCQ